MGLISYADFGKLRLFHWFPNDGFLEDQDSWYGLINEGVRGIHFMRSMARPDETFHVHIDLLDCPLEVRDRILETIRLPVKAGCSFESIKSLLGEPVIYKHVRRRHLATCEFRTAGQESFEIRCVVTDAEGLTNIWIRRLDIEFPKTPDEQNLPPSEHRTLDEFEVLPENINSPESPVSKAKVWMETSDRFRFLIQIRPQRVIDIEAVILVIRNRTGHETTRIRLPVEPCGMNAALGVSGDIDKELALRAFVELSLRDAGNHTSQKVYVELDQFYGKG